MPYLANLSTDTQTRTLQLLEAIAREIGLLPPLQLNQPEPTVPTVTKSIGTTGRDYSTITLWEADLDNTTPYDAGDDALGECYDDSAFDEAVTINGGGTIGLASRTLSVAAAERHDGTAGTGARIVLTTSRTPVIATSLAATYVEWLEINVAGFDCRQILSHSGDVDGVIFRRIIGHDANTDNNPVEAFNITGGAGSVGAGIVNSILYDVQQSQNSATRACYGINLAGTSGDEIFAYNNTVYKVEKNLGSTAAAGIRIAANVANFHAKNNIAVATGGSTSGTIEDFDYAGTDIDDSNNLSSDATADDGGGSGHVIDAVTADQFVSTVDGSEDLHLKTGADAIDAGADLGTTPTGVNIDIDGRDRDAEGDTWDIGADEFVAAGGGLSIPIAMYHRLRQMGV